MTHGQFKDFVQDLWPGLPSLEEEVWSLRGMDECVRTVLGLSLYNAPESHSTTDLWKG